MVLPQMQRQARGCNGRTKQTPAVESQVDARNDQSRRGSLLPGALRLAVLQA